MARSAWALSVALFGLLFVASSHAQQLLQLIEVCRHGDRAPIVPFNLESSSTYVSAHWPLGLNQLTARGMVEHYELGLYLREIYINRYQLLSPTYNYNEVYVRSSDVDRTLMSAQSQLTGWYNFTGPSDADFNPTSLPFHIQPIPIHTVPQVEDNVIRGDTNCDRLDYLQNEIYTSSEANAYLAQNQATFNAIQTATGQTFGMPDFWIPYDNVYCNNAHGYPLLPGLPAVQTQINDIMQWRLIRETGGQTPEIVQLTAGGLVNAMLNQIQARISSSSGYKFVLYSGHDTTVSAILNAFGRFDGNNPPYNSTVLTELWQETDGSYSLGFMYNWNVIMPVGCTPHPLNNNHCTLQSFQAAMAPISLPSRTEACIWPIPDKTPNHDLAIGLGVGLGLTFVFSIAAYFVYLKRKSGYTYSSVPSAV